MPRAAVRPLPRRSLRARCPGATTREARLLQHQQRRVHGCGSGAAGHRPARSPVIGCARARTAHRTHSFRRPAVHRPAPQRARPAQCPSAPFLRAYADACLPPPIPPHTAPQRARPAQCPNAPFPPALALIGLLRAHHTPRARPNPSACRHGPHATCKVGCMGVGSAGFCAARARPHAVGLAPLTFCLSGGSLSCLRAHVPY